MKGIERKKEKRRIETLGKKSKKTDKNSLVKAREDDNVWSLGSQHGQAGEELSVHDS
jgi:hypothetical protein